MFFKKGNKYALIDTLKAGSWHQTLPQASTQGPWATARAETGVYWCFRGLPKTCALPARKRKALGEELGLFSRGLYFSMDGGPVKEPTGSTSSLEGLQCAQLHSSSVLYVFIPREGVSAHVYLGKEGSALLPPSGLCRVTELCVFLDYRQGWDTQHLTLPSLSHHRKARQWQFYLKVEQRVLLFFLETKHLDLSWACLCSDWLAVSAWSGHIYTEKTESRRLLSPGWVSHLGKKPCYQPNSMMLWSLAQQMLLSRQARRNNLKIKHTCRYFSHKLFSLIFLRRSFGSKCIYSHAPHLLSHLSPFTWLLYRRVTAHQGCCQFWWPDPGACWNASSHSQCRYPSWACQLQAAQLPPRTLKRALWLGHPASESHLPYRIKKQKKY